MRVLVLAGLEPTGRAGLLADVEAIRAAGGRAVAVATALTAQGRRTFRVAPVPPAMVIAQVRAALELEPVQAVKVGLAPDLALLRKLRRLVPRARWVVDPVVRTSRGETLSRATARDVLSLAAEEVVITPNLDEAAWLLGDRRALREPDRAAERLVALGFGAAVVKGGHRRGPPVDVVADRGGIHRLEGRRLPRAASVRGTGCRFASALAVGLARGKPVAKAAAAAKRVVEAYLRAGAH